MRQPGGLERLDQTRLLRAPSDIEDEQDNNRPRLTYFSAVSQSLPVLAPRPRAWQNSKLLSSSALLANDSRVLDDITQVPRKRQTKPSRHPARVPNSVSEITEDTWEESTDTRTRVHL